MTNGQTITAEEATSLKQIGAHYLGKIEQNLNYISQNYIGMDPLYPNRTQRSVRQRQEICIAIALHVKAMKG